MGYNVYCMSKKERTIALSDKVFMYKLIKRKGQQNFSLSVYPDGRIILTVPKRASHKNIEKFISKKTNWLEDVVKKNNYLNFDKEKERYHYKKYKEKTREFVSSRLIKLNELYNFKYGRVSIRLNRTRWGSCSSLGNLNFDYRILFLKPDIQDYLLVHELCHLKEMNHSKRFWKLVEIGVPDYKYLRNKLKEIRLR